MNAFRTILILLAAAAVWLAPATATANNHEFRFRQVQVEPNSETPRVCFVFDQNLIQRGNVHYEDYVRFEPEFDAAFTVNGKRLCVDGVEHGKTYSTDVLKGMPDSMGRQLRRSERFNVSVPDRKPSLAFSGAAYILPSKGDRKLPLDAVNVSEAELRILRIDDRNLIREINQGRISSLMSSWATDRIEKLDGELVWEGFIEFDMEKNKTVSAAVPIGEILGEPEPGIYVVMAIPKTSKSRYSYEATQWVIVSDIGISSFSGADGMRVFLRSLQDATPLAGRSVQLIARNNDVLGVAKTDAEGKVRFAAGQLRGKGGARPGALMAFGRNGEFNFLDLTKPSFDLTDRGVGGRAAPGPVDAFLYTDRGVYRPGETANIVALMRDDKAFALGDAPLTLKLYRPDGTVHDSFAFNEDSKAGAYHLALPLSASARTGRWTAQAFVDPKAPPVGKIEFQVEDFVPERMEVELTAASAYLEPGVENTVDVNARFLYGAPAADLAVKSEMVLQEDMNPFPTHKGYKFGLVEEEWRSRREELPAAETDAEGRTTLSVILPDAPDTTRPLKAMVRVSVAETGGRAVSRTIKLPVRSTSNMIGVKPKFGDSAVKKGQSASFEIILVGDDGQTAAGGGLVYELHREHYRYNWYYTDSGWDYTVLINSNSRESGELDIAADAPAALSFRLDWGRYRLEVQDPQTGAATSVRFRVGWYGAGPGDANVPDKLEISLDKKVYRAGETAKVHIKPPFAGRVLMTVAGSSVYETRNFDVPAEGRVVELPVSEDWDAGAYVTATVFRAAQPDATHKPSRAIGVAWLARDYRDRTLEVAIDAPERMLPRQTIEVGIKVDGVKPGEKAFVTLSAVDEGILQLTNYRSPAPAVWYFGKRRLGVELRDDYGRLIASAEGVAVRYRQGGDGTADRQLGGLEASSIKTVSLYSGIVEIGPGGRVKIPLEVPDFNGRLRLMAVAWSAGEVGSADAPLTVRDPVVSQMTLPRFLAPGDESRLTLTLHNLDGPVGKYTVTMETRGAVSIKGASDDRLDLAGDEKANLAYTLKGRLAGVGAIMLKIEGPEGFTLERDWEIAVRPAQALTTTRMTSRLRSGERNTISDDIFAEFLPGSAEALVTLSNRPDMNLPYLLRSLDRYPYGCLEQTTSRAFPLLYVGDVAASIGVAENDYALRDKVQGAIGRVFTMQRSDGSFGLWNSQSPREEWLTAYVMDFLTQAKELDYDVPVYAYRRGLEWISRSVRAGNYNTASLSSRVYGIYVLSRAGKSKLKDLRYMHDVYLREIPTALGRAQLGAALARSGDRQRASSAFGAAVNSWQRRNRFWKDWGYYDYGTTLRDMAGTVYLASWSEQTDGDWAELAQVIADIVKKKRYLSTQEKAWLLLAANELGGSGNISVAVNRRTMPEQDKPVYLRFGAEELAAGVKISNQGDNPLWQAVTVTGVPREDLPAENEGFVIFRQWFTLDGDKANLSRVRQGDTLVAVITGKATNRMNHQALVVDLLPAGFEIENSRLVGGRGVKELAWLPELSQTKNIEMRDDRFVAALDIDSWGKREFTLAYVVRAVSPGVFRAPAVHVEDMYKPVYFGRNRMGDVTILPAR